MMICDKYVATQSKVTKRSIELEKCLKQNINPFEHIIYCSGDAMKFSFENIRDFFIDFNINKIDYIL